MHEPRTIDSEAESLEDLIRLIKRDAAMDMNVARPAKIVAVTEIPGQPVKLRVQVGYRAVFHDFAQRDGSGESVQPPLEIANVRPYYQGGSGGYSAPKLAAGDFGFVVVFDRSIDLWLRTGQAQDPVIAHSHNMGDVVFLPGWRPDPKASQEPMPRDGYAIVSRNLQLGAIDAPKGVVRLGDDIQVNDPELASWIQTIQATLKALTQTLTAFVPVPQDGGAALSKVISAGLASLPQSAPAGPYKGITSSSSNTVKAAD